MSQKTSLALYVALMTLVVVASNMLVQYPVAGMVFGINLADLLTWGAFTYPVAFLITDLTNRQFGPSRARLVVACGFVVGVTMSFILSEPRIAIASGTAFLVGQLLDISVFNQLRRQSWWQAPLLGSLAGSVIDTFLFFTLGLLASLAFYWAADPFATEAAPILGVLTAEAPRWVSWALGDLAVKMIVGLAMLLPYGALMGVVRPMAPGKA